MSRIRKSMLFIPGNNPSMIQNAGVFGADSVILDLEDAVSMDEKDSARNLVYNGLMALDFGASEKVVRINPLDTHMGIKDLSFISKAKPDAILVPKADEKSIKLCCSMLDNIEKEMNYNHGQIKIIALIETAYGVEKSSDIIQISDRVEGILLGGEDLTADLGVHRTLQGDEIFYGRTRLVMAAKAFNKQVIDTPFTDVNDNAGLRSDSQLAVKLGFTGKALINPRQIDIVHEVFSPTEEEIKWATDVLKEWEVAKAKGLGVFSFNGKMVDAPILSRAKNTLKKAGLELETGGDLI
ncbi:HpcH/HpaI aldolase/citrate lyase family protein [Anaeromicrobium sediminis]|uniref:CoA ester lyase n=1 Tax=Anaeromicrobium sediminis TaxID=1478221 RepID=A0A267MMN3_9FIRM|nr:aldolase/citrate lyase family protein [Anaeromicrobium sediminis]PAB60073.1 CoA ester lyase [Anaeromicrobium sediminis]